MAIINEDTTGGSVSVVSCHHVSKKLCKIVFAITLSNLHRLW